MPVLPQYVLTDQTPAVTYDQLVQFCVQSSSFTDGLGNVLTQSLNITASFATTTSYTSVITTISASWASSSLSSSYSTTSSFALNAIPVTSASWASASLSSSYSRTSSFSLNAIPTISSSWASSSLSSSYTITSSYITASNGYIAILSASMIGSTYPGGMNNIVLNDFYQGDGNNMSFVSNTFFLYPNAGGQLIIGIGTLKTTTDLLLQAQPVNTQSYFGIESNNSLGLILNTINSVGTGSPIIFEIGGNEKGRFASNGFVGIGTQTPKNSIDIIGNISCSAVTASLFLGTSSFATTASYALNALSSGSSLSASYSISSSQTISSSFAESLQLFNPVTGKWYYIIVTGSLGNETLAIIPS